MKYRIILLIICTLSLFSGCVNEQLSSIPITTPLSNPELTASEGMNPPTLSDRTLVTLPVRDATKTLEATPTNTTQPTSITATSTIDLKNTDTLTPTIGSKLTLGVDAWKLQPVIPIVSDEVIEIYQRGLELGNDPHAFSKIGDCGSTPTWFLGDFDRGNKYYRLGEYQSLATVIEEFKGSFDRTSLAARSGFNASALFTPLWSDLAYCQPDEAPLTCEYRVHRPVIAFIMLGANDVWHPEEFEPQMRKIIEFSIENGVIPILSTKADNQEKDHSINVIMTRLATEYDVPLWNFWRAVDPLPGHGLQADMVHLTWGGNLFDDPSAMTQAWPVRNLTALQILDAIWQKVTGQNP
jgi:hypothetical protein